MIYANVGGIRDPLKQSLTLGFCRNQNKDISILPDHDQIYHTRNNWLGSIFFSSGVSHIEGLLVLLHPGLEGVTEADTDPKGRIVSFKVTPSNDRVLCVYVPSGHITREQLARGRYFEGLQNYMENKNERNENKIIHGDFTCIMDKIDRDGGKKAQTQPAFTCSKLTIETLEQGVKYVQS